MIAAVRGLLGSILILLGACESNSAPTPAPMPMPQYRLLSIASVGLPIFAFATGADSTFLTMEVVTLRNDGIANFMREHRTFAPGAPVRVGRSEFGLNYTISGATIQMDNGVVCVTIPCPRINLSGSVSDSTLLLASSESPNSVYRYARLVPGSGAP